MIPQQTYGTKAPFPGTPSPGSGELQHRRKGYVGTGLGTGNSYLADCRDTIMARGRMGREGGHER